MRRFCFFLGLLVLPALSLRAWESQFMPWNAGAGKYQEATVNVGGTDFRLPDFSYSGYKLSAVGLGDGIPCNSISITAVAGDDLSPKLNQAVTTLAAVGGGTIYIPAGAYVLNSRVTINADNIVIKGAGSGATLLTATAAMAAPGSSLYEGIFYFTGNASNIAQWILQAGALTNTSASADIPHNAVSVQALNASIFGVGDWVVVQQFFTPAFVAATSASTWLIPPFASQAAREFSFTYVRKVTSVGGSSIGIDAPIPRPLAMADGMIYIYKPKPADYSENLGLEGLTLYTEPRGVGEWTAVMWKGVFNGWARDVKLKNFNLHGFQPQWAARITMLDCATDLAQYIGGGGQGYSYHVNASQGVLVRRCSSINVRHNITTQKPLCSDVVFSRMDSSTSTQQDDTHHSYAHNVLWDMHYQHGGVGLSATNRGTTSGNGYETFAGGVVWNHHGDGVTTGGWQAGRIQIRPDNYLPQNQGFVIGNWGGHRVYDNSTDINSSYVVGTEITGAGPQVGPRGNVAYEGINSPNLSPASLFEAQLANRLGSLPPDVAPAACGASPTPTATRSNTPAAFSPTFTPSATRSGTPSATRTQTPSATATASPSATATRTPSATPSRTPSPSPSPTPTPLGTWGAEKQLDPFKATAQIYSAFQPAGAGSALTLAVDSGAGNFTEGSEAVRANITFNAVAGGFAELLRGYGTQTLDLSFDPYGLSFWIKGSVGSDTVRLMLFEDQNMNGNPYDAGDEVWASAPVAVPGAWTKIVVPFSSLSVFAGTGNSVLDLNRIYAWRLVLGNGAGTAHSSQVWVDDLRQLTTYSPASNNSAVLGGSFIQLWNSGTGCGCGGWSQAQWDAELLKLKDLCQDTVYVQYGAWEDNAWYAPEGQSFLNFSNPALGRIFQSAQALGMKVVVGLWFGESWNTDDKTLAATYSTPLSRSTAVAGEIAALYGASPAFGGWYIPQEVNDLEWPTGSAQLTLLRNYLRDVAAAAKAAKSAPVYLAPFFGPNRPADDLQAWWDGTLAVATGIDVLIPQDGVGTTRADGDVDVPNYFAAIKAAALGRGRSFGATVESFAQTDGWPINGNAFAAVPAPIAQLKGQLWEAKAAGASTLVQFEYPYMQATRGAAYAQLYSDYQAYQGVAAPCAYSPTPTPTLTRTATRTSTSTPSPSPSFSPTRTPSATLTGTQTGSPTASPTRSPSPSPTASPSLTASPTRSASPSASPTPTRTVSPSSTPSASPASTATVSPTPGGPSFSGHLLYSLLSGGHYLIAGLDLGSGVLSPLTAPGTADDMNPMVSPDQRYAVFYSDRDGDQEIWRLDLLSFAVTQLTSNTASDYDPAYSPDGSKIVFKSNRDDGLGDIFVMNADGSGQVNLTAGRSGSEEWDPVFSQDGSKIYFGSRLTGGDPNSDELFVMDADGSNVVRLTNNSVPDWYPAVNPVDGRVAFVSKSAPASDDDLFVMNADGSGRLQLSTGNGDEGDPAWSPEAGRLAFVRWNGSAYDTYIANADGSGAALAPVQTGQQLGPCWWQPLPATPTPSATASSSPSATPTPSPSPTPSGTWTPSGSPTASVTASPSQTASPSATPTLSATASPSSTVTGSPSLSPTVTPTPNGSSTHTPTSTRSATGTATPSPTFSSSATSVATFTATPSRTASVSPLATATATWTAEPPTATLSATSTLTPLPATPTPSPATSVASGSLEILEAWPVPNPDPAEIRFKLAGPATKVRVEFWTPNLMLLGAVEGGPFGAGWHSLAMPPALAGTSPLGLLYYTVDAQESGRKSPHRAPGRLYRTR